MHVQKGVVDTMFSGVRQSHAEWQQDLEELQRLSDSSTRPNVKAALAEALRAARRMDQAVRDATTWPARPRAHIVMPVLGVALWPS